MANNTYPIAWHERNLACRVHSCAILVQRSQSLQAEITRACEEIDLLAKQIAEAKRRNKTSFDSDRFLVTKETP